MQPSSRACALALATSSLLIVAQAALAGPLPPCPALPGGTVECFDAEPSGSAASAGSFGDMSVVDGLILSEADASFLLGMDTTGWATSGAQGVLNSLQPVIEFLFDSTLSLFHLSVLALPGPFDEPVPVVLQGFRGDTLVATDLSNISLTGPDGTHQDLLTVLDGSLGFDRVRVFAALAPCSGADCEIGATTSVFVDTVEYMRLAGPCDVPEPGAFALALAGLTSLGAWLRKGGRR